VAWHLLEVSREAQCGHGLVPLAG